MSNASSAYGAFPEYIHLYHGACVSGCLGITAVPLAHYQKLVELLEAHPDRAYMQPDFPRNAINQILSGKPHLGPLAQKGHSEGVDSGNVVPPVAAEAVPATQKLPKIQPGDPLSDGIADEDKDGNVSDASKNGGVTSRAVVRQRAQQRYEHAQKMAQQEKQQFENFVRQLHQVATIKTEADVQKFLTQELVKKLITPGQKPPVSAKRMQQASHIFRNAKTPKEALKKLREVDPDFANTLQQSHR